jgi:MFS family permease
MPRAASATALTLVLASAEVFGMAGFATFTALLPVFIPEWRLSDSDAGWISGVFYAGYLGAVPVLTSLTDRIAPRRVYIAASLAAAIANFGFAFVADGFWSAILFRALAGIGLAGTYMPGLKLLADHVHGAEQSRMVAFYTAGFSIGSAVSLWAAGLIEPAFGWRAAFAVAGAGPLIAIALLQLFLPREDPRPHPPPETHVLDFRPVLACRAAMAYVLAYTIHNFEVFAARSWLVVYLVFAASRAADQAAGWWHPATLAALFTLLGVPATILGNELAIRFGRMRMVAADHGRLGGRLRAGRPGARLALCPRRHPRRAAHDDPDRRIVRRHRGLGRRRARRLPRRDHGGALDPRVLGLVPGPGRLRLRPRIRRRQPDRNRLAGRLRADGGDHAARALGAPARPRPDALKIRACRRRRASAPS